MNKFFVVLLALSVTVPTWAKSKKKEKEATPAPVAAPKAEEKKNAFKSIKEVTEKCIRLDGLFPMYQDTASGKSYIEVSGDQLGKEFIYFLYVLDGVVDAGYFRGAYADNGVISFDKYYDKIEVRLNNTDYYFDPGSELSKAASANINQPILASEKIQALTVDTLDSLGNVKARYLIEADALFLTETFSQIKPTRNPNAPATAFSLGTLSTKKTKYLRLKNYPANTDVEVEYVYDNPAPVNRGTASVTDARNVSVKVRHTLIEMPENNYRPRYDDPRVGYFLNQVTELTSTSVTPYRDMLRRWHLEKKDPSAAVSEPVEPIVFWIENTTPAALRPIIKDAVERWNIAFEAAGFKNAVVCNIQPDTADWDAGDIRYNVIRWTSSPEPPFGGYGPSFSNPRTGQLIGADIMLEWVYLSNRVRLEKIFDIAGLAGFEEEPFSHDHTFCTAGRHMQENIAYGNAIMQSFNFDSIQKDTFLTQALIELVLHEVGHTLGLNHNFAGSSFASNEQWQNKVYGETVGLSTSVMDYNIPNISPDKSKQGLYFTVVPGLYDIWAIRYGYTSFDPAEEESGLRAILSESVKREHLFFNDADDMRNPGKGTDPRAMLYDMTSDPISYAIAQIDMNNAAFKTLKSKFVKQGQSYHELRNAYLSLSGRNSSNLTVLSRWIGGVFVNRNFAGQDSMALPYTAIPVAEQKRAMTALAKYAFSPRAFDAEGDLYNFLQIQRRGYGIPFDGELPKIHTRALNLQKVILDQLLHVNTLNRIIDSRLMGNDYTLNRVLADLTDAIIKEDIGGNVNSMRQQLQVEYVNRLLDIIQSAKQSSIVKAAAYTELEKIRRLAAGTGGDAASAAHKKYLTYLITSELDKK